MKLLKRSHLAALAAALMGTLSLGVWAQSGFPSQPIKIIVPFTPGTGMDTIARVVAPRLSERLGQSVVVQNQPGASGNIGADAVAKSTPDGYTVLMGANTMLMASQMYKNVSFDPVKDFSSVTMAAYGSLMLVANPKTGIKSLPELITMAKARPGGISFGSPGVGTPHHMAMELFKLESNTFMLHVPYRGSAGGGIEWTTQANTAPSLPVAGDFWYDSYTDKKYQYTNDGVSNYWVDQSFPTSYSSLAVTGNIVAGNVLITGNIVGNIVAQTITANVVGSVTGNLTGNVFGNLIGNSYGNSTGTHFGNVTGNLTGAVLTGAQPAITGVGTLSSLSVTGNITTSAYFFGDGSQLTGISSTGSFIANGTSNVSIATTNGNITATVGGTEILKITSAGIENSRANGAGNIGNSTTYFNTVFAKATSAQYADLAEMYIADAVYPPGTVLIFGGTHEVTASSISHDPRTAGVVSTNPSYLMNSGLAGPNTAAVALTGRVPCWVQGPVAKGDRLVNIDTGVAGRLDMDKYEVGCVIGKSLEAIKDSSLHLIEIAIGRY